MNSFALDAGRFHAELVEHPECDRLAGVDDILQALERAILDHPVAPDTVRPQARIAVGLLEGISDNDGLSDYERQAASLVVRWLKGLAAAPVEVLGA